MVGHPVADSAETGVFGRYQRQESKRLGRDSGHGSGLRPAAETEGLGKHDLTGMNGGGPGLGACMLSALMSERAQSSRSRREKPIPDLPATVARVDAVEAGNIVQNRCKMM